MISGDGRWVRQSGETREIFGASVLPVRSTSPVRSLATRFEPQDSVTISPWKDRRWGKKIGRFSNGDGASPAASFDASGHLITSIKSNDEGFFQTTSLDGQTNGVAISSLVPTGTAVPGNEIYPVDNLVRLPSAGNAAQLTEDGFAFSLPDGTFVNPFYKTDGSPPEYLNFTSNPATVSLLFRAPSAARWRKPCVSRPNATVDRYPFLESH
jgi:hypothetical protein